MSKLKSALGALIFTSFGAFIGMLLTIESGLYDAYYTDDLETISGKKYYTAYECKALFNEDILSVNDKGIVTDNLPEPSEEEQKKNQKFKEYLQEEYGN